MSEFKCECPLSGHCDVFNREMRGRLRDICQGKDITPELRKQYIDKWMVEAFNSGGTHKRLSDNAPKGAGTHLHRMLDWWGLKGSKKCGCESHAKEMDRRGVEWCEENKSKILGWMREGARERSLPFLDSLGLMLIDTAIQRAKDDAVSLPITRTTSPELIAELFLRKSPIPPWPKDNWQRWENVQEGFRIAFNEAKFQVPRMPVFTKKRGVVICAGGWRFFPSLYVTVRILRETGCTLPIQVWYLGKAEYDPRMQELLSPWNVEMVDGVEFVERHCKGMFRCIGGWEMKAIAVAYSPFREVFSLDADCYPVYNIETFMRRKEYLDVGAVFWPDHFALKDEQYDFFGVPRPPHPIGLESGQFLVDKQRCWKGVWLSAWLNGNSDYIYPTRTMVDFLYGDKDTFAMGFLKAGNKFTLPRTRPGWRKVAFLQKDFDGKTFLIHRTMGKFKFSRPVDGEDVSRSYSTTQVEDVNTSEFPHDAFARRVLGEIESVLCTTPALERYLLEHVPRDKESIAVDVGANVGDWGKVLGARFKSVVMFEPIPSTADLIPSISNSKVVRSAVSDFCGEVEMVEREKNTLSSLSTIPDTIRNEAEVQRIKVPCITLDSQVWDGERVGFVKVDVEGAEVNVIQGALKLINEHSPQLLIEFHSRENRDAILCILENIGYNIFTVRHPHYQEGSELFHSHGWLVGTKKEETKDGSLRK